MSVVMDCGGGDALAGAAEHSAVRRLRHRRALAFLWLQGLERTFDSMILETDSVFSVVRLRDLVTQGQWRDAIGYLQRFLPLDNDECLSVEAKVLHHFLVVHMDLADILAGTKQGDKLSAFFYKYHTNDSTVCHGALRIRCLILTALHAKQHLRASLNWELVRQEAAEIVYDLVHKIPELKGKVRLPPGPLKPHNILPICSCPGWRCHRKKRRCGPQASVLAKSYIQKRRRLHSSRCVKESPAESDKKLSWVADIVDESLKAGKCPQLRQEDLLQTSGKQGATSMFGTLAGAARNAGMSSVVSADERSKAGEPLKLHQGHPLRNPGKEDGSLIAGKFPELHEKGLLQASGKEGATSASISQTIFGTLAGAARNPGMSSVANAGTHTGELAMHDPGAPFLRTILGAGSNPISQGMFGTLTDHSIIFMNSN
ncbi:unnamed protein product [Urochloa decumbens]|uniref:Uncharacterized protein n=1 Tax=Urochloa decumbens TaxID=240449 RepID=A0ABC9AQM7_9POAL